MTALPIDMVSDVVCPWCFIGKRRLEKAIALKPEIPVEVRFRPYFLNPWVARDGISREDYLTTKFGSPERYRSIAQRVAQAAAAEGLTYELDKIKRQPNTLDCHRLILWAGESGHAARMKQRLMDLYFTEGGDLTDRDVLVRAAADCGLDADLVRQRRGTRGGIRQGGRHRGGTLLHLRRPDGRVGCAGARIPRPGDRARRQRIRQARRRGVIRPPSLSASSWRKPGWRWPRSRSRAHARRSAARPWSGSSSSRRPPRPRGRLQARCRQA